VTSFSTCCFLLKRNWQLDASLTAAAAAAAGFQVVDRSWPRSCTDTVTTNREQNSNISRIRRSEGYEFNWAGRYGTREG